MRRYVQAVSCISATTAAFMSNSFVNVVLSCRLLDTSTWLASCSILHKSVEQENDAESELVACVGSRIWRSCW